MEMNESAHESPTPRQHATEPSCRSWAGLSDTFRRTCARVVQTDPSERKTCQSDLTVRQSVTNAEGEGSPSDKWRLLVADDDGHIREVLRYALQQAGYDVVLAEDGTAAWSAFEAACGGNAFDLVILDILMPGLDGLDLCRRIRQKSSIPLIFVSSKDEELDRILGLEMGADDYVTKPFSPRELVARVRATLRRYEEITELRRGDVPTHAADEMPLRHGPLSLDVQKHECSVGGTMIVLTVSEFSLLEALLRRPDQVLSRKQLVDRAYGPGHFVSDRTVDSHIRRIRQKLKSAGHSCIETVYGIGYRLVESP